MYDFKTISLYFLAFSGIFLLAFPSQLTKLAPENQYIQQLVQYKQIVAFSLIAISIYLYLLDQDSDKTYSFLESSVPSETTYTSTTVSERLPSII